MEIDRALIDKDFNGYVLASDGVRRCAEALLPSAVLPPLDAVKTTRKAQWEARIHHNALVGDPFRSQGRGASVAYYVDAQFRVVQLFAHESEGTTFLPICELPSPQDRRENVSLQVAGRGVLAYNDGCGTLRYLVSADADTPTSPWAIVYEYVPVVNTATLLLKAMHNAESGKHMAVLAEPLHGADKEAGFRLWVTEVSRASGSNAMDIDSGSAINHSFEVGVVSSLPGAVSFKDDQLLVLLEGKYELAIGERNHAAVEKAASEHKRHHDDGDQEIGVDEVLSKVPRAGIGYHGDISDVKHPEDLALDLGKPIEERFRKSSVPYSSLEATATEEMNVDDSNANPPTALEAPTPETILGGFEECDDMDPNASAELLLISVQHREVTDRIVVNCRSFRFLCSSSSPLTRPRSTGFDTSLLFQNDVHGLVYSADIISNRVVLRHQSTLPAFGFVQASKQDKKFMTIHEDAHFACIGEFEKRMFVYHGIGSVQETEAHTRKQNVVEIGEHQLLGLCVIGSTILVLSGHHVYQLRLS